MHNDINYNIYQGKVTSLNVLDLPTTFDTTDHHILIKRLSTLYCISDKALSWISSYLKVDKPLIWETLSSLICNVSHIMLVPKRVPKQNPSCSVLGPLLFTLYTTPLCPVIQSHSLDHHLYADKTETYVSLATPDIVTP